MFYILVVKNVLTGDVNVQYCKNKKRPYSKEVKRQFKRYGKQNFKTLFIDIAYNEDELQSKIQYWKFYHNILEDRIESLKENNQKIDDNEDGTESLFQLNNI